jgi:hypothetical protein
MNQDNLKNALQWLERKLNEIIRCLRMFVWVINFIDHRRIGSLKYNRTFYLAHCRNIYDVNTRNKRIQTDTKGSKSIHKTNLNLLHHRIVGLMFQCKVFPSMMSRVVVEKVHIAKIYLSLRVRFIIKLWNPLANSANPFRPSSSSREWVRESEIKQILCHSDDWCCNRKRGNFSGDDEKQFIPLRFHCHDMDPYTSVSNSRSPKLLTKFLSFPTALSDRYHLQLRLCVNWSKVHQKRVSVVRTFDYLFHNQKSKFVQTILRCLEHHESSKRSSYIPDINKLCVSISSIFFSLHKRSYFCVCALLFMFLDVLVYVVQKNRFADGW